MPSLQITNLITTQSLCHWNGKVSCILILITSTEDCRIRGLKCPQWQHLAVDINLAVDMMTVSFQWMSVPYHGCTYNATQLAFQELCVPFVLCCVLFGISIGQFYPYLSGLLHRHWGNHMIAPVPVKQPWRIWANTSCTNPSWNVISPK